MSEDKYPPLDEIIKDQYEKGREGEGTAKIDRQNWLEFFSFKEDPFTSLEGQVNAPLFQDRVAEVKFLANLVGQHQKENIPYHLVLVGPRGIGTKTLLLAIHSSLQRVSDTQGLVVDLNEMKDLGSGEEYPLDILDSPAFKKSSYIFLYDCHFGGQLQTWLTRALTTNKLVISAWRPFQYALVRQDFGHAATLFSPQKEIYLRPLPKTELINLVKIRLKILGGSTDSLPDPVLFQVVEKSGGNINTLFFLLREIHRIAMLNGRKHVELADLTREVESLDYTLAPITFSDNERDLVLHLLRLRNKGDSLKPSQVSSALNWDPSLTSRYFKRLEKLGVLQKESEGGKPYYRFREEFLSLAEGSLMQYLIKQKVEETP